MTNKIMEKLEFLEDSLESIKWLITTHFSLKKVASTASINAIRRSAGILSKAFLRGGAFEDRARKGWTHNALRRIS